MRGKIGINALLNVVKQGLSVIFPLITYPYVLRILSVENLGKVTYSQSIISYFLLFAMLGVSTYGVREGAKIRTDKIRLEEFASQVFTINLISTILAYVFLSILIICFQNFSNYKLVLSILSLQIIFTTFGLDWINTIFEDFKAITVRSIIAYIISLLSLFIFVKTSDDYCIYAFITILGSLITCLTNIFYIRKYVHIRIVFSSALKKHIKPLMIMLANNLAISIYVNLDLTMLGMIQGDYAVGIYSTSVKIYTVVKNIIAAIYIVSIPQLSELANKGNTSNYKNLFTGLCRTISLLLIPISIGLFSVASNVLYLFGGGKYGDAVVSLKLLSISLLFAIFGGLFTACLNISLGREAINLKATILGAIVNCGLNLFFIYKYSYNGAAFTTLLSEGLVLGYCFFHCKDIKQYLDIKLLLSTIIKCIFASLIFAIFIPIIQNYISNVFVSFVCSVLLALPCYFILLICLKENILLDFISKIKARLGTN